MPISRFDTSVHPDYVSSHISLPFAELAGIAANQQKSFNEGKSIEDDLGLLGQAIKAAPMYEGHRQSFIKEYQSKIKELTGNGNINYADPEFKRKASMLVNEFKSRPEINAFANTLKSYQDWEGQVKSPDNAMNLDFTYKKDKDGNFNQLDVNKQGVYSPTFTKFEDYNETGKKIMGKIATDGYLKDSGYDFSKPGNTRINNGETEVFNSRTKGWEGVSSGKLGKLSEMMVGEYANTVAGKHHLQSLIGENITYNQLDDETKAQVNKIFKNHLYNANANQVGGNTTDKLDYHFEKDRATEGNNDKIAQIASTTPEILNLKDNGELSKVMPEGLSKFYSGDKLSLTNDLNPGNKDAGDRIAKSGGWLNLELESNKSSNVNKNAVEYTNQLFENASKILGTSKKDIANIYKNQKDGYNWLKSTVEDYYTNLTLQKNTVATLQGKEQATATSFFLGDNVPAKESGTSIGSNIRSSEITDLNGNQIIDKEGINSNNYSTSSIGFEKPGQVVLSGNDGTQLLMNTNYETFKKITKPVVDIVKNSDEFKKTFELTKDQKSRLGSQKPLESTLNIDGSKINKTQFDKHQFNIGNTVYSIDSYLIRENGGQPVEYHYIREQNQDTGEMSENTLTGDQLKVKFSNSIINSPEFRGLNAQKENKVLFDNQ